MLYDTLKPYLIVFETSSESIIYNRGKLNKTQI